MLHLETCLNNNVLSKYFNNQEIEMLLSYNKIISFASGETILKQGKKAEGIYIIIDGRVIVTARMLGESIANIEALGPGSFFGEISFIEDIPCATTVTANKPTQCLLITEVYLKLISVYFPETKYKLLNAMVQQVCERIKHIHDKITAFITKSEMITRSFFGEMIHSLTKPARISFDKSGIDINQLKDFSLLKSLNKDEIDELFKDVSLIKANKNWTLIHAGDQSASCYVVIQGAVQSSIVYDNKHAKLSVIGPGTLIASTSCIDSNDIFTITFSTCEQALLLKISKKTLDGFKNSKSQLWYKLFELICKSLIALEKSVDKLDIRLQIEIYNR